MEAGPGGPEGQYGTLAPAAERGSHAAGAWASGVDGQSLATCLLSFNGGKVTVSTCMSKKPPGPGPDGLKKVLFQCSTSC